MRMTETRKKGGRTKAYEDGTNISLFLPRAVIDEVEGLDVPTAYSRSRNAKIVALLEWAISQAREGQRPATA